MSNVMEVGIIDISRGFSVLCDTFHVFKHMLRVKSYL